MIVGFLRPIFSHGHDGRVAQKGLGGPETKLAFVAEVAECIDNVSEGALCLKSPGLDVIELHVQTLEGNCCVDELIRCLLHECQKIFQSGLFGSSADIALLLARTTLLPLR